MDFTQPLQMRNGAIAAFEALNQVAADARTDLYTDYNSEGELTSAVKKCIELLESQDGPTLATLVELGMILGFTRLDPLVQMLEARRLVDLEWRPRFSNECKRFGAWGLMDSLLEELTSKHTRYLLNSILELSYRRGKVLNDHEAIRSILWSKGNREPGEYFFNVISGWLAEEGVAKWLQESLKTIEGLVVEKIDRSGLDADRVVRFKRGGIGGDVDLKVHISIEGQSKVFQVEIQRADVSRKKRTLDESDKELVTVPEHRKGVAERAKQVGDSLLFLFPYLKGPEDGSGNELGMAMNPLEMFEEYRDEESAVRCKFYEVGTEALNEAIVECFS